MKNVNLLAAYIYTERDAILIKYNLYNSTKTFRERI